MCRHYECYYYAPVSESCDYMLITGKRRPCPPTDDCECLCTEFDKMERLHKYYKVRTVNFKGIEEMEKVYVPGMYAPVLASLANVSHQEALAWMRKVHPECTDTYNSRARFYDRGV